MTALLQQMAERQYREEAKVKYVLYVMYKK